MGIGPVAHLYIPKNVVLHLTSQWYSWKRFLRLTQVGVAG